MPDGETLDFFQREIAEAAEGMEDVTVRFHEETDQQAAEIRVTGWRAMREDEERFIPA
ncbi:MAG: hypothetical protein H9W81_07880 [Enterococcus sp.]|nr:hypothetical protein [Enterococcus sp.]